MPEIRRRDEEAAWLPHRLITVDSVAKSNGGCV
jgi:hypothetical protein